MRHQTHEFDRWADVRAALADPALVPEPPAGDVGSAGASVAWLRSAAARFSSGRTHRRRRALVEAELARLEPVTLRDAAAAEGSEGSEDSKGSESETRVRVVRVLAEALGMPEPGAVAEESSRHALALAEGLLRRPLTPFARLHHQAAPLLLPNAWDYASAAALAAGGFPAIGTTSLGVAAALGLPDGAAATADATVALARRLGRGSFLFTVDAEGGFSDDVVEVVALAERLYAAGAAGINLEDGRADGTLAPVALHAAKIAAVKSAVPALFVNARTDTHWLGREQDTAPSRLAVYEQAGADGVFVPGLSDPDEITALTSSLVVPLNILYAPSGPPLAELAAMGVRRVSLGSLLYRGALASAVSTATAIRDGRPTDLTAPSYAEVQGLSDPGE
ncbi:isocitrate lyase/phosphoenolpyruvate mutase family protein [Streptomyces sp. NPDC088197]|uniref:isocitrate lyase/PEP mutase family protein n=1 Tax=Streptomyces sp. NPDC088197 TaxID=3365840 RepID=UPI003821A23D